MFHFKIIFDWAHANTSLRNVMEAEGLLKTGHTINCGEDISI